MIYGYARVSTDGQSVDAQVQQLAAQEPVEVTHHRKPKFVLMSITKYQKITSTGVDQRHSYTLDTLPDDLAMGLLPAAAHYE